MGIVYGYVWGIWWWRCTGPNMRADSIRSEYHALPADVRGFGKLESDGLATSRQQALEHGVPSNVRADIVVSGQVCHTGSSTVALHQWNGFVPTGALCVAGAQNYVSSPEFCFVQVACVARQVIRERVQPWQLLVILVELGCELCGTYSKQNTPRGFKNRTESLTNTSAILLFAGRVAHVRGVSKVVEVLPWLLDNLRSPMETALYLMLCLPSMYGGCALTKPFGSNVCLEVPKPLWNKTGRRRIYPDLFWPEFALVVEYDSDDAHAGRETEAHERAELAQDMGYKVVTFRRGDLLDIKRFREKAASVARAMGKQLPSETPRFVELQSTLHKMLVLHERWM